MQLENYIVKPDTTVIEAMKVIDNNAEGIVYVCENDNRLMGAVTDGDIRRYIIHNGDLNKTVECMMTRNPITVPLSMRIRANECLEINHITSIPVVDEDNTICEIVFLDSTVSVIKEQVNAPVVIMAGGKGTRLRPYTQILPKPLIPIGEKTITEHIIERFVNAGCNKFDMIVNYKKHLIKSYFRDIQVPYKLSFYEEEEYLGTAGGLRLLLGCYDEPFFMTNCDILVDEDYANIMKYHKASGNIATIVSAIKNTTLPYGVIETTDDGRIAGINEKPDMSIIVNTGFYVLEPEFIKEIPDNTFIHITDVIKNCISTGRKVGMYPISGDRWLDMGQMDELQVMTESLASIR